MARFLSPGSHVQFIGLRVAKKYPYEKDLLPKRLDIATNRRLIERLVLGRCASRAKPLQQCVLDVEVSRFVLELPCHPPASAHHVGRGACIGGCLHLPKEQEDGIALLAEAN